MKLKYFILFIFLFIIFILSGFFIPASAQQKNRSTLSGKVFDAKTGEPVPMVNVFFINTTIGAATSEDGSFIIPNIPNGAYTLLINHVGYTLQTLPIQFITADSQHFEIKLQPTVYRADEVKVEAREDKEWKKYLKEFTKLFLGKTENAKKCTILNPEVLDFQPTTDHEGFLASSDSIIKVENLALGYNIDVILGAFKYNEDIDATLYTLYPKFNEMQPKNNKEQNKWHKARMECYEGSLKHFISSLAKGYLKKNIRLKESFEIYHTMNHQLKGYQVYPSEQGFIKTDSLGLKKLEFDNYLSIYYKPGDDIIYDTWLDAAYKETEKSYIKLNSPYVLIDEYGNIFGNYPISVYGEWAKLRVADLLPLDLIPDLDLND
jgi:hypothetical protein